MAFSRSEAEVIWPHFNLLRCLRCVIADSNLVEAWIVSVVVFAGRGFASHPAKNEAFDVCLASYKQGLNLEAYGYLEPLTEGRAYAEVWGAASWVRVVGFDVALNFLGMGEGIVLRSW